MAKSIPAIVTPEVLQWARGLDRISIEEIALKLKVLRNSIVFRLPIFICPILRKKPRDWIRWIIEPLATGELKKCLVN